MIITVDYIFDEEKMNEVLGKFTDGATSIKADVNIDSKRICGRCGNEYIYSKDSYSNELCNNCYEIRTANNYDIIIE